jgi:hypothetical protein
MSRRRRLDSVVRRIDATRLRIDNPQGVPVTLYANSDIPVDAEAIDQLLGFVSLQQTLDTIAEQERAGRIAPFWGDRPSLPSRARSPRKRRFPAPAASRRNGRDRDPPPAPGDRSHARVREMGFWAFNRRAGRRGRRLAGG